MQALVEALAHKVRMGCWSNSWSRWQVWMIGCCARLVGADQPGAARVMHAASWTWPRSPLCHCFEKLTCMQRLVLVHCGHRHCGDTVKGYFSWSGAWGCYNIRVVEQPACNSMSRGVHAISCNCASRSHRALQGLIVFILFVSWCRSRVPGASVEQFRHSFGC